MAGSRPKKKYYTVEEANATLPLLRSILRDVTALAGELRGRHEHLARLQDAGKLDAAHDEEVQAHIAEFERGQERMREYEAELTRLQIELKDYFTGLIDFRAVMDGREVYLCWRLGEPEVAHWHELDAGFAGRRPLAPQTVNR
jgi:hypothetical protein